MAGCTDPLAVNYNPSETVDNGSCRFVVSVGDVCYAFRNVDPALIVDRSFTLSWAIEGENWVFYHDYVPDYYFHTREQLYTLKNNKVWKHNLGPHGVYYEPTPKAFHIDVVFNAEEEFTLNAVKWLSEVINTAGTIEELSTITHITIWNSYQCTGRIPIQEFLELDTTPSGKRKLASEYSFVDFRDILITRDNTFLMDIFNNYAIDPSKLDPNMAWYEERLIEDKYIIIRFEFDNMGDKSLSLHAVDVDASQSIR